MTNREKRVRKLYTYELIESIEQHIEALNEHPELRPAAFNRGTSVPKNARITVKDIATLLLETAKAAKEGADLGARWRNYKAGGVFPHDPAERARGWIAPTGSDPFDLDRWKAPPGDVPADADERAAFEQFLDGTASAKLECRFARYICNRMSYELMCQVAWRATELLGWDPGPLYDLAQPPIADPSRWKKSILRARRKAWEQDRAADWPAQMEAWQRELGREIEERLRKLGEHHGWTGADMVALARRVGKPLDDSRARMRDELEKGPP